MSTTLPGCLHRTAISGNEDHLIHYRHEPLDLDDTTIRLVRVSSELSEDGTIQCRMKHVQIEAETWKDNCLETTPYTCLSYTWGDPTVIKSIQIDGKLYHVRQNLWHFLDTVRTWPWLRQRFFWIDALCIDQQNKAERNHQVQQMGRIFSRAEVVICWLGRNHELESVLRGMPLHSVYNDRDAIGFISARKSSINLPGSYVAFCWAHYWSRAWVTQEVALARRAIVIAGTKAKDLQSATEVIQSQDSPFHYISNYIKDRKESTRTSRWGLLNLLHHFRSTNCAIPRDRIYSLLALCSEGESYEVNYNVSEEQVMRHTLEVCGDSLCFCSAAVVVQALWSHGGAVPPLVENDDPYIEVTVRASPPGNDRCVSCESPLPIHWTRSDTLVICVWKSCIDMHSHLICHRNSLRMPKQRSASSHSYQIYRQNSYKSLPLWAGSGSGIDLISVDFPGDPSVAMLRLSFRALVNIVRDGLSAEDIKRRCENLWRRQRRPGKRRKDRMRFCGPD